MILMLYNNTICSINWVLSSLRVNKEHFVKVLKELKKRFCCKKPEYLHQDNAPAHNSILLTNCSTEMGIKTFLCPLYSPDLAHCEIWSFLKDEEDDCNKGPGRPEAHLVPTTTPCLKLYFGAQLRDGEREVDRKSWFDTHQGLDMSQHSKLAMHHRE